MDDVNNNTPFQNQPNYAPGEVQEPKRRYVKLFAVLLVAAMIIVSIALGILKLTMSGNNYKINKAAQFKQTYDSLPIQIVTTDTYFGSGTTPLPKCGNGTVYKSIEEAMAEKINKVCILALDYKDLKSVPDEVVKLKDLEFIFLRHNLLATFPKELLKLPNIKGIDITGNQISDVPTEVNDVKSLIVIVANDNKIPPQKAQVIRDAVRPTLFLQF